MTPKKFDKDFSAFVKELDKEFNNISPVETRVKDLAKEINSSTNMGEQLLAVYNQAENVDQTYTVFAIKRALQRYLFKD